MYLLPDLRRASYLLLVVLVTTLPACAQESGSEGSGSEGSGSAGSGSTGSGSTESHSESSSATGGQPSGGDWPRFLNRHYDGVADNSVSSFDWSTTPRFDWSIEVGEGYGIGSVAAGRYYQFDAVLDRSTSQRRERLRCFELDSGRLIWSQAEPLNYRDTYGYESGPRSSPTIAADRIVTFGVAGRLVCRRIGDGAKLWEVDTSKRYGVVQNFFGVASSPLVLGEMVIVMVGGSPAEDQDIPPGRLDRVSPNNSAIVAFDLATGQEQWRCGADLASYSSPRPITLGAEQLVLLFARGGLLAVDPTVGKVRWQYPHRAQLLESVNAMVPVVDGDRVLISECYQVGSALLRVSGDSAKVIWKDSTDRRERAFLSHWSTPVLVGQHLYGCSGRHAPKSDFRCIDFSTGEVMWIDPRSTRSSVTRVGEHLLVMEEMGLLQVLKANPEQLEVVSELDLSEPDGDRPALRHYCWSAPVVVGDRLIVRGDQRVLCLSLTPKK